MTAVDKVDCERIDHQGFVPEIFAGLFITSLYLMQLGPSIPTISDRLEDVLALLLFLGSLIGMIGVVLGTTLVFRKTARRTSYIVTMVGLPFMVAALGWYTYATVDSQEFLITALAGGLGLCIEIGLIRLFVDLLAAVVKDDEECATDA